MKLSIRTELDYDLPSETDVLLQLEAAAIPEQTVEAAHIDLPPTDHFARVPGHDTIGERIWLRHQGNLKVTYTATVDVHRLTADCGALESVEPHLLPGETVEYLMPSRYCPSDEFQNLVDAEFGESGGGSRVMAIRDWIEDAIDYCPGSSTAFTGAMETYVSRQGVCRDFAHLMITLVRASGIPARFASVYGIGVQPQDFHAVAEVFLDNTWYLIDPTGMSTAQQMAKIGVGRDAADVSFLTSYGFAQLNAQQVWVEEA
ncbi:transglutaminase [Novosphingobium marinum]|uniref:Transglutaminase-like putative cysteine protease n=1 Tax=Novosphingobium marinum TaxID=1514948 RepID=A0A7Z0BT54_9SPHN|nr:transglutaminase family protein [Novosphingobium marinum]NYH94849.1 transglutaminase-like putative cysteine protease [Novosphingobium marinum]GGC36901.1 transglutaminase [Novosphingobium marinum]